jgi:hypothetical protein
MRISIHFNSREEQHSEYDWADISIGDTRVGKARCKIDRSTITVNTLNIYPEWEGHGYGREFVEFCKDHFSVVVAARVRHESIGFWETMEFIDNKDGCWVYYRIIPDGEI